MDNQNLKYIRLQDGVFAPRQRIAHDTTIPDSIAKCRETGRLEAFKLNWKPGMPQEPHVFWDSDVAKVMEGMAQMLIIQPDPELERQLEEMVQLVVSAQQPDGYLNCHFTVVEPERRWANLGSLHELYCAGHLIEAAVAHFDATGRRTFLDAMCRYADYIAKVFGRGPGQRRGYPGHEELELALVKLYRATGERRYLELAKYFVDERGASPNYFSQVEKSLAPQRLINQQAHLPVRQQEKAEGHAVRATYLYCGMADVAAATGDQQLLDCVKRLFDNIVTRRMYITGGIGSDYREERFTEDYDLPAEYAYSESCAAIGLALLSKRLLDLTGEAKYADTLERVLYNNGLSGIGLSGDHYLYVNRLAVTESTFGSGHGAPHRQPWFDCSCCPTNYCRFLPQLGGFCAQANADQLRIDIPAAMTVSRPEYQVAVTGGYPYDGRIQLQVLRGGDFTLKLRIPGWCRHHAVQVNGGELQRGEGGYWSLRRQWQAGDTVVLTLELLPRLCYANAKVPSTAGKAALCRGPLVYCVETKDNPGVTLHNILLNAHPELALAPAPEGLPQDAVAITTAALQAMGTSDELYSDSQPVFRPVELTFIPYALWDNRGDGAMQVFCNIMPAARRE